MYSPLRPVDMGFDQEILSQYPSAAIWLMASISAA
jgi:hypothetical protein